MESDILILRLLGIKPHGRGGDYMSVGVDVGTLQAGRRELARAERTGPSGAMRRQSVGSSGDEGWCQGPGRRGKGSMCLKAAMELAVPAVKSGLQRTWTATRQGLQTAWTWLSQNSGGCCKRPHRVAVHILRTERRRLELFPARNQRPANTGHCCRD